MKRVVRGSVSGGLNYNTDVEADFYDLVKTSDFPADVVNDLKDVVRSFDTKVSNVMDCFEENFGVRPDPTTLQVFSIGSDNINVTMLSGYFASEVKRLLASSFQQDLSEWADRTKNRMKNSQYYVDTQIDHASADGKAGATVSLEED